MRIIVTDLTRFSEDGPKVCLAGIDPESGMTIRPLPYLTREECSTLGILPGTILEADFSPKNDAVAPHLEDHYYPKGSIKVIGACSSDDFLALMQETAYDSIQEGFGVPLEDRGRTFSEENIPNKSLITIQIEPEKIEIVRSKFDSKSIKLHFSDSSGYEFKYEPIADLGFKEYTDKIQEKKTGILMLNRFIHKQDDVFLRIGIGRIYQNKFWIQVNGIYTFPDYHSEVRSHK